MLGFHVVKLVLLKLILWLAFFGSLAWTFMAPALTDQRGPPQLPSPSSLFVLIPATGFLIVISILETAAADVLLAIQSIPPATAQAIKRIAKPGPEPVKH